MIFTMRFSSTVHICKRCKSRRADGRDGIGHNRAPDDSKTSQKKFQNFFQGILKKELEFVSK